MYENSDIYLHFGYCDDLGDGRGFTSGIIGFCTATGNTTLIHLITVLLAHVTDVISVVAVLGDGIQVIQAYNKLVPQPNEFSTYYDTLVSLAKNQDSDTSNIKNYCKIWAAVSRDPDNGPLFRQAQMQIADSLDYVPAMNISNNLGLQYAISRGQMYDA